MDGGQPNKRVRLMGDHRVRVSSSSDSENDEGVGNTFGDPPDELSPPGSPPPDSPPSSGGSSSSSSSETSSSEDEVDDDDVSNLQDYSDELLVFAYKMLTRARSESEELEIFELATLVMDGMNRFNYADYKRLKAQLIEILKRKEDLYKLTYCMKKKPNNDGLINVYDAGGDDYKVVDSLIEFMICVVGKKKARDEALWIARATATVAVALKKARRSCDPDKKRRAGESFIPLSYFARTLGMDSDPAAAGVEVTVDQQTN